MFCPGRRCSRLPPDPHREAARKLASAVILQALKDAHNDRAHPVRREQARAWLAAPSRLRDFWLRLAAVPADWLPAARTRRRWRRTRKGHGRGGDPTRTHRRVRTPGFCSADSISVTRGGVGARGRVCPPHSAAYGLGFGDGVGRADRDAQTLNPVPSQLQRSS
jgi:hypothetical protein